MQLFNQLLEALNRCSPPAGALIALSLIFGIVAVVFGIIVVVKVG